MPDIHRWQYQYLGATTFPKTLSAVEFHAFFTFSEEELSLIRSRYKDNLKIAAAIQLGFLKMTGAPLEAVKIIPPKLLRHVAEQLKVPVITIASLRAIYVRQKTLYEHHWWAMEILGFTRAKADQVKEMLPYLSNEARYVTSVDVLVERGRLWLYQHRFLAVADRVIQNFARKAMAESEAELFQYIRDKLPLREFNWWEVAVLKPRPNSGSTTLEWLQQPPRRKSINSLRERIDRIDFLKGLGVHKLDLDAFPLEKIKSYAAQLYNIRPAKYRELKDPTRTLRLVCYLRIALMQTSDSAILMGGRQISKIVRHAYDKARLLEAESMVSYREVVNSIFEQVDNESFSDSEFREFVRKLKQSHKPSEFPSRAAAARWILSEPNPRVRALLNELQKLEIEAESGNQTKTCVDLLNKLYRQKANALPEASDAPVPAPWRDLIEGEDRERAMRALEAATLVGLRKSLRSGAVFIEHSEKFRGRHRLLIDEPVWQKERIKRYAQLNLPLNADDLLDQLYAELEVKLSELGDAISQGQIRVDGQAIHVSKPRAAEPQPEIELKKNALFAKIGVVQLPDLILEMDSRTGFSKVILGRPARNQTELLQIYAGVLAHGSAIDASGISLMVPQLSPNQIIAGMRYFENPAGVRAANDAVVGFQRRIPITAIWGDGTLASSDMMSLDVSRQIWVARLDPKRNVPSVGTYTHVSDFWSVIYDQPIVLNERQAGAAIEGVIRQKEVDIDRLAVDTHGYTEFAMGIAKLLGFALCPRLARLAERKLYLPSTMRNVPESLQDLVIPNISLKQIRSDWDHLVRVAASIETGHTSATVALARFGTASSDSPIYRAGVHFGRLIRSLYLCDYFLSEDLRRTVNRILVHGEAVHTLQRAINAGSFSKPRGQREEELYAVSGSLTLMTNLCLAWTANKIQQHVVGDGNLSDLGEETEWLKGISPAHFSNINFRGTFNFQINEYSEWLLSDAKLATAI